jgi:hypothetical protein
MKKEESKKDCKKPKQINNWLTIEHLQFFSVHQYYKTRISRKIKSYL